MRAPTERDLLSNLMEVVTSSGRYPIGTKPGKTPDWHAMGSEAFTVRHAQAFYDRAWNVYEKTCPPWVGPPEAGKV